MAGKAHLLRFLRLVRPPGRIPHGIRAACREYLANSAKRHRDVQLSCEAKSEEEIIKLQTQITELQSALDACTKESAGLADELKSCQANHGDSSGKINELETALKACNEDREKATQTIATLESDVKAAMALAAKRAEEIKRLEAALAKASVDAVVASEKTAASSVEASAIALEATKLILARAESLEASRKAESLDGFTPEPAK